MAQPLAAATGATIVLVTAGTGPSAVVRWRADDPTPAGGSLPGYLEAARQQVAAAGGSVQIYLGPTPAAATIMDVADQVAADLIVMSTHGRSGWQRLRLGSIAWDIVQLAQRPVLLMPPLVQQADRVPQREAVAASGPHRVYPRPGWGLAPRPDLFPALPSSSGPIAPT